MTLRYPLLHSVTSAIAMAVVSFVPCVVLQRPPQMLFSWKALPFMLLSLCVQQLVLKYYPAATLDDQARRETIAGLIAGSILGLFWWT